MKQKSFLLLLITLLGTLSVKAQSDVTSTYLSNTTFDENTTGWTVATEGTVYGDVCAYGETYTNDAFSADNAPVDKYGHNSGKAAILAAGWGSETSLSQNVTLPAGTYKITFDVYNGNTGGTLIPTNHFGWVPGSGDPVYVDAATLDWGIWFTWSVTFTLDATTAGTINLGYVSTGGIGSGTMAKLFVDNVKIFRMDTGSPTLETPVDYSDLINQTTWSFNEDDGAGSDTRLVTNVTGGEWTGRMAERWRGAAGHYGKKLFQTISLPAGVYQVKAACMTASASGTEGANALHDGILNNAYFYANDQETTYPLANATSKYMTQTVVLPEAGNLEFGIKTVAVGANWSAIGSVSLVKIANNANDVWLSTDETYYLYNEEGGGWLREGNSWGSEASLKPYGGIPVNLEKVAGGYKLWTPCFGNTNKRGGLGANLFLDNETPEAWVIEKDGDYYILKNTNDKYLASNGLHNALVAVDAVTDAARWKIISKTERTAALANATEAAPKDATYFIAAPDFSRHYTTSDWEVTTAGGNAPAIAGDNPNNNWEKFNGTFDIHQTLTGLPSGTYKMKVQGYYRPGANNITSTVQNAELYAGEYTTPLQLIYSEGKNAVDNDNGFTTANTNGGATRYVPNGQGDASKAYDSGAYDNNELTFYVDTDGTITLGARKATTITDDWTDIDNFRLFYLGNTITEEIIDAILPTGQMNETVYENLQDAKDNLVRTKSLASYNALFTAIDNANASIAEYERIRDYITNNIRAAELGDLPLADFQSGLRVKYSDGRYPNTGTYRTFKEIFTEWRTVAANYWSTHAPATGDDLTAFILNQSFEFNATTADHWTHNDAGDTKVHPAHDDATYAMSNSEGNNLYNAWDNSITTLYIEQTLTGLPEGFYDVQAVVAGFADASEMVLSATALGEDTKLTFTNDKEKANGTLRTLANVMVGGGTMKIRMQNTGLGETFFKIDNVRLIYRGNDASLLPALPRPQVTGIMRAAAEAEQTAAYADWDGGNHTVAAYLRAKNAHEVATVSHAAYLKAEAAVTRVEALLNNTNVYTYDAYVTFYNLYNSYKTPFDARTLPDNDAAQMELQIFGQETGDGSYRQPGVPVVTFLGSAWDHAGDDMWDDPKNWKLGFDYNKQPETNYWVNTWSHEGESNGSNFKIPFLEYWNGDETLESDTLTAIVKAVPQSDNTITAWVRARIVSGTEPIGITLQVNAENTSGAVYDRKYVTPTWTRIGETQFWQAHVTLTGGKADYDSDGDGFGDLRIQFVIDGDATNVSWFSFRDVMVDYGDIDALNDADWTEVVAAIADGESKRLGFWGGEYAPYNNVQPLKALEALKAYNNDRPAANAVLVKNALAVLRTNPGWKQNPGNDWVNDPDPERELEINKGAIELNAVSWRSNYTTKDIIHTYDYNDEGDAIDYDFKTIIPDGWDLNGWKNGYDTRIMKYDVNTNPGDVGIFAAGDSIAMFCKRDTKYGEQMGYTMPLKPGTKYSLTFIYCNWANEKDNEAESFWDNDTYIVIRRKDAPGTEGVPIYNSDDDTRLRFVKQDAAQDIDYGNVYPTRWKPVRAYFTTEETGNTDNVEYVLEFQKSIKTRQIQMAVADLYILKYREHETLPINGQSTLKGNTNAPIANKLGYYEGGYQIDNRLRACKVALTRTLKAGQWNSFCLPVKVPYRDMRQVFQINGRPALDKLFVFTGTTHRPNDVREVLNFTSRQGGIQAGQPVLVKPDVNGADPDEDLVLDGEIILKNYVVKNNEPIQRDPARIYDFVGTYGVYNVQQWDVYVKHDNELDKDVLARKITDDQKTWLQPTRAFFRDVSDENPNYGVKGMVQLFGFAIDDEPTGIMAVEPDGTMTVTSGNIYDLNGRLVRQNSTSLEGLPRGIYIVDGRKVLVR